jgi:hypothetical protein
VVYDILSFFSIELVEKGQRYHSQAINYTFLDPV